MKFSSFMNSLLTNLIPLEINLVKISRLKFMFKMLFLSQYLMDSSIFDGFQQMSAQM